NAGTTGLTPSGLINFTTTGNQIVMGNADHTTACIKIAWTYGSDIRYKCVWGNVSHGRDFLRGVNPIEYSFKDKETNEVTDPRRRYGFSAQEILELEGDNPVIVNTQNPDSYGITYDHIIPVLVNAIKELDAENKAILARLEALENR
ncbi:MAG: tail fiber domain-containing protein, partial [Candidatus Fonsibacter ubiquis]